MKVVVIGATGMVGAGALREALNAPEVESVLSISRQTCSVEHPKLRELLLPDLFDFAAVEDKLAGYDACIWAIGISAVGLDEAAYARVTEELMGAPEGIRTPDQWIRNSKSGWLGAAICGQTAGIAGIRCPKSTVRRTGITLPWVSHHAAPQRRCRAAPQRPRAP